MSLVTFSFHALSTGRKKVVHPSSGLRKNLPGIQFPFFCETTQVLKAIYPTTMAANSVLLDFSIEPTRITDELSRKDIVKVFKENVEKYFGNLTIVYDMLVDDGYLVILRDNTGVILSLRFFNEGLITLNIEYFKKESQPQKISFEVRETHFQFSFNRSNFPQRSINGFEKMFFALILVTKHAKLFFMISNYTLPTTNN